MRALVGDLAGFVEDGRVKERPNGNAIFGLHQQEMSTTESEVVVTTQRRTRAIGAQEIFVNTAELGSSTKCSLQVERNFLTGVGHRRRHQGVQCQAMFRPEHGEPLLRLEIHPREAETVEFVVHPSGVGRTRFESLEERLTDRGGNAKLKTPLIASESWLLSQPRCVRFVKDLFDAAPVFRATGVHVNP